MHAAAVVVGLFAAIFGGFFVLLVSTWRVSRRGYQAGTVSAVVIVAILAGFALFFVPVAMDVDIDGGLLTVAAPLCFLLPPAAVLAALPRRKPRRIFSVSRVTDQSLKSRDSFGNIQVTFLRELGTDRLAADIDIDRAAGFKHGLEVIGNAVLNNRTNPYAVRELLLATDLIDHTLDPGYQFRF